MRARGALAAAALLCAACGPPRLKLPSGPGIPSSDAADAIAQAMAPCRRVTTITAEIAVSGSAAGHRVRGRLSAGLAAPASVRLEAVAPFGQPLFILVATDDDATLLLPRDERVLEHGRPAAVLEAIAGVALSPAELRSVITGCASSPDLSRARQAGELWRIVSDNENEIYLHRDAATAPWRAVATLHGASTPDGWRAEYRDFQDGLPRKISITSVDSRRYDLQLSLSQIDVNAALAPEVFRVQIPRSAEPITIAELRRSGPLGGDGR